MIESFDPMITDSHAHLASHRFSPEEVPALIQRAVEAGVARIVTLATGLDDLEANLRIASEHAEVHACLGIHPCEVHEAPDDAIEVLRGYLAHPRVCGIGETGLDYYHPAPEGWEESAYRERQQQFLRGHFELAVESGLPLVIHTRDRSGYQSLDDALEIYREYQQRARAVFHCFIGSPENARRVLEAGGILSFGGVSTFKSAREVRETIASCPPGSFMLETDSPYLAPEPHRGSRNEPAFTALTAKRIAEVRSESLEELAAHTEQAAENFFRFHRSV